MQATKRLHSKSKDQVVGVASGGASLPPPKELFVRSNILKEHHNVIRVYTYGFERLDQHIQQLALLPDSVPNETDISIYHQHPLCRGRFG